jgi:transcriptional regulator with XRE-family HTH domain
MSLGGIVARNIRRLRLERGLTQEALAVDAGIDRTYVSRLERGLENPTVAVLEKLARALSSNIEELFSAPRRRPAGRAHERGLTQEELAVRIRINRNYVGMIERQENPPTVAMVERIAKALGIEPARLFDEKAAGRKGE